MVSGADTWLGFSRQAVLLGQQEPISFPLAATSRLYRGPITVPHRQSRRGLHRQPWAVPEVSPTAPSASVLKAQAGFYWQFHRQSHHSPIGSPIGVMIGVYTSCNTGVCIGTGDIGSGTEEQHLLGSGER